MRDQLMDYYRGSVVRNVNHRSRNKKRRARCAYVRGKRVIIKKSENLPGRMESQTKEGTGR